MSDEMKRWSMNDGRVGTHQTAGQAVVIIALLGEGVFYGDWRFERGDGIV